MRHRPLLALSLLLPASLCAQFDVTLRAVEARYGSHASASERSDAPSIHPLADLGPGIEVGFRRGEWRVGLGASRVTHDLSLSSGEGGVTTPNVLQGIDLTLQVGRSLVQHAGSSIEVAAGISGTQWSFIDLEDPSRWRWGPVVSAAGVLPVSGTLGIVSRVALSHANGAFDDDELPDGFTASGTNRFEWSIGVRIGMP